VPAVRSTTAINTFSGQLLDFADPNPDSIELTDIAHGLSIVPRFGAQALAFRSVAQHAVFVSQILEQVGRPDLAAAGLHHDSHEAFACDVPSPLKRLLQPRYDQLTDLLDAAIAAALGLDFPDRDSADGAAIKDADRAAFAVEAEALLAGERPSQATDPETVECARALYRTENWGHAEARDAFLGRAVDLRRAPPR
jgi:5'-deoxynucleotidase YfbR-like HD superfamily hydrolase